MPYPVYPIQNQTAQQLSNIGSNLGVAMFGDANSMMRRAQIDADQKYKNAQLDIERQKLGYQKGVWDSEIGKNQAMTGLYGAQTATEQQATKGARDLAELMASNGALTRNQDGTYSLDPTKIGALIGAQAMARKGQGAAQDAGNWMALALQSQPGASENQFRQGAALRGQMPSDNTAFTTSQVTSNSRPVMVPQNTGGILVPEGSQYSQATKDYATALGAQNGGQPSAAPAPDASAPAPTGASIASAFGPQTTPPISAGNPFLSAAQGATAPTSVGNAIVLPGKQAAFGTASSRAKANEKYTDAASVAGDLQATAEGLANRSKNLHISMGGIPVLEGLQTAIIGRNPQKAQQSSDLGTFQELLTRNWLDKSSILKGAITEREGAELRKGQPTVGDSPEKIQMWLGKVGWFAGMKAQMDNINAQRTAAGQAPVDPISFKQYYVSKVPPPQGVFVEYAKPFGYDVNAAQSPMQPQGASAQPVSTGGDADLEARLSKYR
jgi:hypothetical protein